MKTFFDMFDKNRFFSVFKIIFLLLLFILAINSLDITYSRYESGAISNAKAKVAFYVVESGTYEQSISLSNIVPSDDVYLYTFTIQNYKGTNRTKVNLNYKVEFKSTTNLPLDFLIINGDTYSESSLNIIENDSFIQDESGMYYRKLSTNQTYKLSHESDEVDAYTLVVRFPIQYKDSPEDYQSLIDLFTITINAEQVV